MNKFSPSLRLVLLIAVLAILGGGAAFALKGGGAPVEVAASEVGSMESPPLTEQPPGSLPPPRPRSRPRAGAMRPGTGADVDFGPRERPNGSGRGGPGFQRPPFRRGQSGQRGPGVHSGAHRPSLDERFTILREAVSMNDSLSERVRAILRTSDEQLQQLPRGPESRDQRRAIRWQAEDDMVAQFNTEQREQFRLFQRTQRFQRAERRGSRRGAQASPDGGSSQRRPGHGFHGRGDRSERRFEGRGPRGDARPGSN